MLTFRRRIAAAVLALATITVAAPAGASTPAAGFATGVFEARPGGYTVLVPAGQDRLNSEVAGVVRELRALGADLRTARGAVSTPGTIVVHTRSCAYAPGSAALTSTWMGSMMYAGQRRIVPSRSVISVCAYVVGAGGTRARHDLEHEFGHALGLAHYRGAVAGRLQAMYPAETSTAGYGVGDRAGLRQLILRSRLTGQHR